MDKRKIREQNERTSPAYWSVENVCVWVEDTFKDKKLKTIFQKHEIDGPVLTKHVDYQMLRYDMGIVIGKAAKITETLACLMDKWEIPTARLLNENLEINLAIGSRHREEISTDDFHTPQTHTIRQSNHSLQSKKTYSQNSNDFSIPSSSSNNFTNIPQNNFPDQNLILNTNKQTTASPENEILKTHISIFPSNAIVDQNLHSDPFITPYDLKLRYIQAKNRHKNKKISQSLSKTLGKDELKKIESKIDSILTKNSPTPNPSKTSILNELKSKSITRKPFTFTTIDINFLEPNLDWIDIVDQTDCSDFFFRRYDPYLITTNKPRLNHRISTTFLWYQSLIRKTNFFSTSQHSKVLRKSGRFYSNQELPKSIATDPKERQELLTETIKKGRAEWENRFLDGLLSKKDDFVETQKDNIIKIVDEYKKIKEESIKSDIYESFPELKDLSFTDSANSSQESKILSQSSSNDTPENSTKTKSLPIVARANSSKQSSNDDSQQSHETLERDDAYINNDDRIIIKAEPMSDSELEKTSNKTIQEISVKAEPLSDLEDNLDNLEEPPITREPQPDVVMGADPSHDYSIALGNNELIPSSLDMELEPQNSFAQTSINSGSDMDIEDNESPSTPLLNLVQRRESFQTLNEPHSNDTDLSVVPTNNLSLADDSAILQSPDDHIFSSQLYSSDHLPFADEPDWDVEKVVDLSLDEIKVIEEQDSIINLTKNREFFYNDNRYYSPSSFKISEEDYIKINECSKKRKTLTRLRRVFSTPNLRNVSQPDNQDSNLSKYGRHFQFHECSTGELNRLGAFSLPFKKTWITLNNLLRIYSHKYPPSQISMQQIYDGGFSGQKVIDFEGVAMDKRGSVLIWQSFHHWLSKHKDTRLSSLANKPSSGLFSGVQIENNYPLEDLRKAFWRFWNFHLSLLKTSYMCVNLDKKSGWFKDYEPVDLFLSKEKFFGVDKYRKLTLAKKNLTSSNPDNNTNINLENEMDISDDNWLSEQDSASSEGEVDEDIFGFRESGAFGEFNEFVDSESSEFSESDGEDQIVKNNSKLAKFVKRLEYNENKNNPHYINRLLNESKSRTQPNSFKEKRATSRSNLPSSNKPVKSYMVRQQEFLKTQEEEHRRKVMEQRKERELEIQRNLLDRGLAVRPIKLDNSDDDSPLSIDNNNYNPNPSLPTNNQLYNQNYKNQHLDRYGNFDHRFNDIPGINMTSRSSAYLERLELDPNVVQANFERGLHINKQNADVLKRLAPGRYNQSNIDQADPVLNKPIPINLQQVYEPILVNPGHSINEADVFIPEFLGKWLKPHQIEGVQFMWRNVVMFHKNYENSKQHGCVIAHAMGLGKTLQVITFIYTLLYTIEEDKRIAESIRKSKSLKNCKLSGIPSEYKGKQVLILCPPSLQINWQREFTKWLDKDGVDVYDDDIPTRDSDRERRRLHSLEVKRVLGMVLNYNRIQGEVEYKIQILEEWQRRGGVLIMGYSQFRDILKKLDSSHLKSAKNNSERIVRCLLNPGPSLVIADEGHMIKNQKSKLSISAERIKTLARICLTGYPLQNNLDEYWTMVNYVFPKVLGSFSDFHKSYAVPISNGMFTDSTNADRQIGAAKLRALQDHLSPLVLRQDSSILSKDIPPKTEYFIMCTLTPLQLELYKAYLASFQYNTGIGNSGVISRYTTFTSICNHPGAVRLLFKERREIYKKGSAKILKNTLYDADEDNMDDDIAKSSAKISDALVSESMDDSWADSVFGSISPATLCKPVHSSKMMVLLSILYRSLLLNEKVLVFTRFKTTLKFIWWIIDNSGIIEKVEKQKNLEKLNKNKNRNNRFNNQRSTFFAESIPKIQDVVLVMDGDKTMSDRMASVDTFNNKESKARIFLITTGTGSIGINLVGASRVVLFDVGWNPLYEEQAIARAYRYNQSKKVYVYRLISTGTWEQTMFQNSRHKVGLSLRVIDKVISGQKVYKDATKKYYAPPPETSLIETISKSTADNLINKNQDDLVLSSLITNHIGKIADIDYHKTSTTHNADTSFELDTLPNPNDKSQNPHLLDMIEFEKSVLKMYNTNQNKTHIIGDSVDVAVEIQAEEIKQSDLSLGSDWTNNNASTSKENAASVSIDKTKIPSTSIPSKNVTNPKSRVISSSSLSKTSLLDTISNMMAVSNDKFPRINPETSSKPREKDTAPNDILEPTTISENSLTKGNAVKSTRLEIDNNKSPIKGPIIAPSPTRKSLLESAKEMSTDKNGLIQIKATRLSSNQNSETIYNDPVLENSKKNFTTIIDTKDKYNINGSGTSSIEKSSIKASQAPSSQKTSLLAEALSSSSNSIKRNLNLETIDSAPTPRNHIVIDSNDKDNLKATYIPNNQASSSNAQVDKPSVFKPVFGTSNMTPKADISQASIKHKDLDGINNPQSNYLSPHPAASTSFLKPKSSSQFSFSSLSHESQSENSSKPTSRPTSSLKPKNLPHLQNSAITSKINRSVNAPEPFPSQTHTTNPSEYRDPSYSGQNNFTQKPQFSHSSSFFKKKNIENTIPVVISSKDAFNIKGYSQNSKHAPRRSSADSADRYSTYSKQPSYPKPDYPIKAPFRNKSLILNNPIRKISSETDELSAQASMNPRSEISNYSRSPKHLYSDSDGNKYHSSESLNSKYTSSASNSPYYPSRIAERIGPQIRNRYAEDYGYTDNRSNTESSSKYKSAPFKNMSIRNNIHSNSSQRDSEGHKTSSDYRYKDNRSDISERLSDKPRDFNDRLSDRLNEAGSNYRSNSNNDSSYYSSYRDRYRDYK
ncbi:Protein CHROMATIN REMODELING 20 [Smittium culicis]|uniref:Protein CHROMATIN REMODELING 20 n=1 Tax=Smittium culicis TaxID=133412 RepID=A0A1R1YJ79_9FUNG|nr:Protein CHROMATIN REMODELING 20 [Smittium culicis]